MLGIAKQEAAKNWQLNQGIVKNPSHVEASFKLQAYPDFPPTNPTPIFSASKKPFPLRLFSMFFCVSTKSTESPSIFAWLCFHMHLEVGQSPCHSERGCDVEIYDTWTIKFVLPSPRIELKTTTNNVLKPPYTYYSCSGYTIPTP